jgi:hypothetical protein
VPADSDHKIGDHDGRDAEGYDNASDDLSERPQQSPFGIVSEASFRIVICDLLGQVSG